MKVDQVVSQLGTSSAQPDPISFITYFPNKKQ